MEKRKRAQIWVGFLAIALIILTSVDIYQEKNVKYHLVEKGQNALYRLKTVALDEIDDSFAAFFVESEISHIEHGIILLTSSWFDFLGFMILALGFGYFCYRLGVITGAEKTALMLHGAVERESTERQEKLRRIEERYREGKISEQLYESLKRGL
jgi:hypothetical protein